MLLAKLKMPVTSGRTPLINDDCDRPSVKASCMGGCGSGGQGEEYPGGGADGDLAESAGEDEALVGEAVEVGRYDVRLLVRHPHLRP